MRERHSDHRRGPPWDRWGDGPGGPWRRGQAPPWWPDGEPWPPRHGPGAQAWSSFGRRMARRVVVVVLVMLSAPVAVGLVVASRVGGIDGLASVAVVWLLVAAVVVGALAVLAWLWSPIRGLIAAAGRLADGDYTARAPDRGPVMTRPVVSSFNRMATRLQEADAQRRQLLADVGHELRTPLTVLRGDLEAMVDGVRPVDEEHLRRLLDDVAMVEHLLDDLRVTPAGDLPPVDVDPVRMREVMSNLVVNAIGATPAGGIVEVTVGDDGARAVVTVHDTGVGIPPDEVAAVFERFHKGSGSSGTGLGLTISRDLVVAHGGTLTIAATSPSGTTMRVELPLR